MAALFFLVETRAWWQIVIDDAFITYRYSENLALGEGIVWNRGEEPVEGYTCPFFMLLLAVIARVGWDVHVAAKTLGLVAHLVLLPALFVGAVRFLPWPRAAAARTAALLLPGIWLLFTPNLVHAYSGMETSVSLVLNTTYALAIVRVLERQRRGRRISGWCVSWLSILAVAVVLTRPETGIVAVLGVVLLAVYRPTRRTGILLGSLFAAVIGLYMIWKLGYFGHLLPNPYYFKVETSARWEFPGLEVTGRFLLRNLGFIALCALGWLALPPRRGGGQALPLEVFGVAAWILFNLFLTRVKPLMGFAYRFHWPAMPFLVLLAICALWRLSLAARMSPGRGPGFLRGARASRVAVILLAIQAFSWALYNPGAGFFRALFPKFPEENPYAFYEVNRGIGRAIGALDLPYETIIDANESGLIPYYAGVRAVLSGLNEAVIAHGSDEDVKQYLRANPFDITYSESISGALDDFPRPQFKAFVELSPPSAADHLEESESGNVELTWPRALFREYALHYFYAGTVRWPTGDPRRAYLQLWVRKDYEHRQRVVKALKDIADFYQPNRLRFGPYPKTLRDGMLPPED